MNVREEFLPYAQPSLTHRELEEVLEAVRSLWWSRGEKCQRFEEEFGADARLVPQNLVDKRKLEICTPDVTIQVSPDRGDLVETRVIGGAGYILIRAEGGVEVNGVPIRLVPGEEEGRPF